MIKKYKYSIRESNPGQLLGRQLCYHYTNAVYLYYIKIKKFFNFNEFFYLNYSSFRTEHFVTRMIQNFHKLTHWSTLTKSISTLFTE